MSAFEDAVRAVYHPVVAEALIASEPDPRFAPPSEPEMARRVAHLRQLALQAGIQISEARPRRF